MPTCTRGHRSSTTDYCDECGTPISFPAAPEDSARRHAADRLETNRSRRTELLRSSPTEQGREPCPVCSAARPDDGRFCETCGVDFTAPPTSESDQHEWAAEVSADRAYYDRLAPDGVAFPDAQFTSVIPLLASEVVIGRRSDSRDLRPAIDLSGELADPGVSHRHAILVRGPDDEYQVVDVGSTNGTTMNEATTPIAPETPVRLHDGDRIHLGAWTTISIRLIERPGMT
jgi:hypothetical protein